LKSRGGTRAAKALLSQFSVPFGRETLNVRVYRHRDSLICERELVERDGTSFTMVLPLLESDEVRALLQSDPYYSRIRADVAGALAKLEKALRNDIKKATRP
jgi:hypothetical protein